VPAGAVFDTAFHRTMSDVTAQYAIPHELAEKHALRRYGFHGISHRYVSQKLLRCIGRDASGTRLITCHLGNGASVCAIRDGRSVDTSMGLTPMEGLVMGTRSGDVDPGLLLHLITALGMPASEVGELLNHHSGLRGICGHRDMREVEQAAAAGDRPAELALGLFAYRVKKYLGAYAAALGGIDAIAFTAGIGEHSPSARARICRGLEFLGIILDLLRNHRATADADPKRISAEAAGVQVWVVPTDEEGQIARELYDALR
jgi:acetate kinase